MSQQNDLPKANQLRFSVALVSVLVIGAGILGLQKVLQSRAEDEPEKNRVEHQRMIVRGTGEGSVDVPPEPATKERVQQVVARVKRSPVVANAQPPAPLSNDVRTEEPSAPSYPAELSPAPSAPTHPIRNTANPASISGTMTLIGTPPLEKVIEPLLKDPVCGKAITNTPTTRFYIVSPEGGLGNVFVYIKNFSGRASHISGNQMAPKLLDQIGCQYEPYVMGAMIDQKILIRNSDPVLHNVHATPKGNGEFNFAQPVQGQINEKSFANQELMIRLKCDVHPWMFAYVSVIDHPYFAVTDETGHFEINNVPDGSYVLEAVHLKAGWVRSIPLLLDHTKAAEPVNLTLPVPKT
jgi:hypothetical protein